MHFAMKSYLRVCAFFLLLISSNSYAQNMGAVNSMMNRQFMNQQMQMQMQMNMMGLRGLQYSSNPKYTYQVILKDSTSKEVSSKIYNDTILHKYYLLFVDKKIPKSDSAHRNVRIYPEQTRSLSRASYGFVETKISGIPVDSCWMFAVISGPISAFSYLSETQDENFDPTSLIGLKVNNGPIIPFTEANLKQAVGNDPDALKNIEKKNYVKAINKYNSNVAKKAKK